MTKYSYDEMKWKEWQTLWHRVRLLLTFWLYITKRAISFQMGPRLTLGNLKPHETRPQRRGNYCYLHIWNKPIFRVWYDKLWWLDTWFNHHSHQDYRILCYLRFLLLSFLDYTLHPLQAVGTELFSGVKD